MNFNYDFDRRKRIPDLIKLGEGLKAEVDSVRPKDKVLTQKMLEKALFDIQFRGRAETGVSIEPVRNERGFIRAFIGKRRSYRVDCPITLYWILFAVEENRLIFRSSLLFNDNSGDSGEYLNLDTAIRQALGFAGAQMIRLEVSPVYLPKPPLSDAYCLASDLKREMVVYHTELGTLIGE